MTAARSAEEGIRWRDGVPRASWATFAYAGEHGAGVRGRVMGERAAQGLPDKVRVVVTR